MIPLKKYSKAFEEEYFDAVQKKTEKGLLDKVIGITEKIFPEDFYRGKRSKAEQLILADYMEIKKVFLSAEKKGGFPLCPEDETILKDYKDCFEAVMGSVKKYRRLSVRMILASGINVCPYCNRDFINTRGDTVTGADMDHFYSRALFPFFALSLYNLVPSCGTCNRIKNKYERGIVSPFDREFDFENGMQFFYDEKNDSVEIKGEAANIQVFRLEAAYEIHTQDAFELMEKRRAYTVSQLKEIQELLRQNGRRKSLDELKEDVFGNYMDSSEFGKRPLEKFYHDLLKQDLMP